jgi:hypothetical protein
LKLSSLTTNSMELSTTQRGPQLLGHSIVSQHFMEPEGSILKAQEFSSCSLITEIS